MSTIGGCRLSLFFAVNVTIQMNKSSLFSPQKNREITFVTVEIHGETAGKGIEISFD
jgi:hypothetical protein